MSARYRSADRSGRRYRSANFAKGLWSTLQVEKWEEINVACTHLDDRIWLPEGTAWGVTRRRGKTTPSVGKEAFFHGNELLLGVNILSIFPRAVGSQECSFRHCLRPYLPGKNSCGLALRYLRGKALWPAFIQEGQGPGENY